MWTNVVVCACPCARSCPSPKARKRRAMGMLASAAPRMAAPGRVANPPPRLPHPVARRAVGSRLAEAKAGARPAPAVAVAAEVARGGEPSDADTRFRPASHRVAQWTDRALGIHAGGAVGQFRGLGARGVRA